MRPTTMTEELAAHRFFQQLPDELTRRLAECATNVVFEAGAALCTEGTPARSFFAIRAGRVKVGVHVPSKGLVGLETLQTGDIMGWSWVLPPYLWHFDAVAVEHVRAIELHADCILPYLEENPAAGFRLMTAVATIMEERLESARLRLLDLFGHDRA
ncbi:MAG TPA: cyclic nucleotide-binding domain-containing protein [Acidimicrobiales bacterium]|nr:cyclic nucleotide-binding domain-containing protein [Acidimicrobiales bacterium]